MMTQPKKTLDAQIHDLIDRAHLDAGSTYYSQLLVTETLREFFRYEYPETGWANGELITIDDSPSPGAAAVAWNMISQTGDPSDGITADNASILPQADIALDEQLNRSFEVPVSVTWTDLELDRSAMQGVYSMSAEKGAAAKTYWLQKINALIVNGSATHNFVGVANMPGRRNRASAGLFSALSSDQILTEFQTGFDLIYGDSLGVLMPDTVAMPTTISGKLRAPTNALAIKSTLSYLQDNYPEIKEWRFDPAMNTAGQGGTAAICIYRNDPSRLRALMPLYMTPKPVQYHGLRYEMIFRSRFAGIACPFPGNICTIYGV